jgi:speckle-type POZ protein
VDDLDVDDVGEFIKLLLVAADRHCMDRMKLICESILSKRLDAESVVNTLYSSS